MGLIVTIVISVLKTLTLILFQMTPAASFSNESLDLVSNPTTFPSPSGSRCFGGLVCVFGTCADNFSRCVCQPGWSGLLCDRACPLDCGGRGLCAVGVDGVPYCKCHVGYTGVLCEKAELLVTTKPSSSVTPTPPKDVTSLRPLSARECPAGFDCRHGYCLKPFTCACDDGWSGLFCHKPCSLRCGRHGLCKDVNRQQTCVCDVGFRGPRCERASATDSRSVVSKHCDNCKTTTSSPSLIPANIHQVDDNGTIGIVPRDAMATTETTAATIIQSTMTITKTTLPSPTTTSSQYFITNQPISSSSNVPSVVSSPSSRSAESQQCMPGFICQHGYCVKGRLKCMCNKGWTGVFCHQKCPLDCGAQGQCYFRPGSAPYCSCVWPYTGSRCQHQRTTSLPETGNVWSTTSSSHTTPSTSSLTTTTADGLTLRPLSVRRCVHGFVCRHGYCRNLRNHTDASMSGMALECVCDRGWKGVFCHNKCPLDCGSHGNCSEFANKTLYCSCDFKYMGPRCKQLRPLPKPKMVEATWHWWVVGSCIFLLLILLVLLVALPYWLWKRKEIFIMKIVYLFQPFEDEDDKLYDAFVSYKSTEADEHFVVHTLYPKLEKAMNFKLCLHFRDFVPGETIANNIIKAMENSRRTILVLTPSYVQSEFCRFEYQRAQHEMLKRKQRIIPIVLQDISSDRMFMDETLKNILDTITYIAWPSDEQDKKVDKFWKRLELSMPKKRKLTNSVSSKNTDLSNVLTDTTQTSKGKGSLHSNSEHLQMSLRTNDILDISKNDFFESFTIPELQLSSPKV
ncbi:platelet endothelial aggregation receptor 1-like [Gigantopelta aegis]|uniref:platelet endothelial aggregation receptor 1-like n=1 Tax=Gigantopelta aegis TaxID=1735272 RepID=UPI001B887548|nr:platelet endothelial aggregation receptor 1-like [Gigantopelta aegis]